MTCCWIVEMEMNLQTFQQICILCCPFFGPLWCLFFTLSLIPESNRRWFESIGLRWSFSAWSGLETSWFTGELRYSFCYFLITQLRYQGNYQLLAWTNRLLVELLVFQLQLLNSWMLMGESMLLVLLEQVQWIQLTKLLISLWRFEIEKLVVFPICYWYKWEFKDCTRYHWASMGHFN